MEEKLKKLLGWDFAHIGNGVYEGDTGRFKSSITVRGSEYWVAVEGGGSASATEDTLYAVFNNLQEDARQNLLYREQARRNVSEFEKQRSKEMKILGCMGLVLGFVFVCFVLLIMVAAALC